MRLIHLFLSVLVSFVAVPSLAAAEPIKFCQDLLEGTKHYLAQVESDAFTRLRSGEDEVISMLWGTLLVLYEAPPTALPMTRVEAYTYVPASEPTARKLFEAAAARGLLILTPTNRTYVISPGPRLYEVVEAGLSSHLAEILDVARDLGIEVPTDASHVELTATLKTLLIQKLSADFNHAWQISALRRDKYLRHAYGLLAQLYRLNLREATIRRSAAIDLLLTRNSATQLAVLSDATRAGFIDARRLPGLGAAHYVFAGPNLASFIEDRMDKSILRINQILDAVSSSRHQAAAE